MQSQITVVNFYNLKSDYNGNVPPVPRRIASPISAIVTKSSRDVSDARIEISQKQYAKAKPAVFDFFVVDGFEMVFIITEIQQTIEDGVEKYTIAGSEIFGFYLSRRCPTLDTIATEGESVLSFLSRMLNQLLPVGIIADAKLNYEYATTESRITTDTEKIMKADIYDYKALLGEVPMPVTKILDEGETLLEWLQDEFENTDYWLDIRTSINTLYNANLGKTVFIYAQVVIMSASDTSSSPPIQQADITTKEGEATDYLLTNKLKAGGPQGAYLATIAQGGTEYSQYFAPQDLIVTGVTEFYSGNTPEGAKYSSLASPSITKNEDGLKNMSWDIFCKNIVLACNTTLVDSDLYVEILKIERETTLTTKALYSEQAQLWLKGYDIVDTNGIAHTGVYALCATEATKNAILNFYNNAKLVSYASYIGRANINGFLWYKVAIWCNSPIQPDAVPVVICDTTKDGGLEYRPKSMDFSWSDYRAFDITQNLDYCYPLALCAYEYRLATTQKSRIATDVNITNTDNLKLGEVIWTIDGQGRTKGFVSAITESRENGTTTKDYEVIWTS